MMYIDDSNVNGYPLCWRSIGDWTSAIIILNSHLFVHHIVENPACFCGYPLEDSAHFSIMPKLESQKCDSC